MTKKEIEVEKLVTYDSTIQLYECIMFKILFLSIVAYIALFYLYPQKQDNISILLVIMAIFVCVTYPLFMLSFREVTWRIKR